MFTIDLGGGADLMLRDRSTDVAVHKVINANLDRLREWEPWALEEQSLIQVASFSAYMLGQWVRGEAVPTVIRVDGAVAGAATARIEPFNKVATLGYWIAAEHAGRGLVTRGVAALLDVLFDELAVARASIDTAVTNRRSRAVAERLGFTHEGTLRSAQEFGDERRDLAVYGLLREEWLARRR
ncbi:MAG: GNAT family N-acetyltransferase [Nocardioides sp.]|nr:GNAT family N-acetyltransferase [Nocardioides sp.]